MKNEDLDLIMSIILLSTSWIGSRNITSSIYVGRLVGQNTVLARLTAVCPLVTGRFPTFKATDVHAKCHKPAIFVLRVGLFN